jgi:hypothetical protein
MSYYIGPSGRRVVVWHQDTVRTRNKHQVKAMPLSCQMLERRAMGGDGGAIGGGTVGASVHHSMSVAAAVTTVVELAKLKRAN